MICASVLMKRTGHPQGGIPMQKRQCLEDVYIMAQAVHSQRVTALKLWQTGEVPAAVSSMIQVELLSVKLTSALRRRALIHAAHTKMLPFPSKDTNCKRVTFADEPCVIGIADAEVDRVPIEVSTPTKLERLVIRASRIFPETAGD